MHKTDLFLLGAHIAVLCKHRSTRDELEQFFGGALARNVSGFAATPDYVIQIDDEAFTRELIRGRPESFGPLPGVSVTPRGEATISPWTDLAPPLPPTSVGVLKNRFVGLHAGTVMNESGACCVLVGERGSGKSTLSVQIARRHGNTLLSDEETIIHARSLFIEPFPRAVHVGTSATHKEPKSYAEAGLRAPTHGGIIRSVVLLRRVTRGLPVLRCEAPEAALVELLQHQRAWGSRPLDSYATMARIAAQCQVFVCEWSDYDQLPALAADIDAMLLTRGSQHQVEEPA